MPLLFGGVGLAIVRCKTPFLRHFSWETNTVWVRIHYLLLIVGRVLIIIARYNSKLQVCFEQANLECNTCVTKYAIHVCNDACSFKPGNTIIYYAIKPRPAVMYIYETTLISILSCHWVVPRKASLPPIVWGMCPDIIVGDARSATLNSCQYNIVKGT